MSQSNESLSGDQIEKLKKNIIKGIKLEINDFRIDDFYQNILINKIFKSYLPFPLMSSWAITPELGLWIYNYIINNKKKKAFEFGSGVSTIIIALAMKKNNRGKLISIEHDEFYYQQTADLLEKMGLCEYVHLILAPLKNVFLDNEVYVWYDLSIEKLDKLLGNDLLDFVLIDGPPASTQSLARYPALPLLKKYLASNASIILDDGGREDEKVIVKKWIEKYPEFLSKTNVPNMRRSPILFLLNNSEIKEDKVVRVNFFENKNDDAVFDDYLYSLVDKKLIDNITADALFFNYKLVLEKIDSERKKKDFQSKKIEESNNELSSQLLFIKDKLDEIKNDNKVLEDKVFNENEIKEKLIEKNNNLVNELENVLSDFDLYKKKVSRELNEIDNSNKKLKKEIDEMVFLINKKDLELKEVYIEKNDKQEELDSVQLKLNEFYEYLENVKKLEIKAKIEAERANISFNRVKGHLSYRLGREIVEASNSLKGLVRLPKALFNANKNFKIDNKNKKSILKEFNEDISFFPKYTIFSLRKQWVKFNIPELSEYYEVWVQPLFSKMNGSVSIEIQFPNKIESERVKELEEISDNVYSYRILSDNSFKLFDILSPNSSEIMFRRAQGDPCFLRINLVEKKLNEKENQINLKSKKNKVDFPKPMKSAIIWQASQIGLDHTVDDALEFIDKYGREIDLTASNLIKANKFISNESKWLYYFNKYIEQFGISPLELIDSNDNKFNRLKSLPKNIIESGPLVSIIMPAFNAEKTLRLAVNSILNQSWKPLELIIVDDKSSDSTWEIMKELERLDPRVKILRNNANCGPYVSKNIGLSLATGDYITGHDADDWAHPERIEKHILAVLPNNIKASLTSMLRLDRNGQLTSFSKIGKTSFDGVARIASISCMFNASFLRKNFGYWDSVRFGADSELIERASKVLGDGFVRFKQLGMLCLDEEGSLTNDPIHGVSKIYGISPSRLYYRNQWSEWHKKLTINNSYLDFPQTNRLFDAPEAALVSLEIIKSNLKNET